MKVVQIPERVLGPNTVWPCPLCGHWIADADPNVVLIRDRAAICLAHEECANEAAGSQS